MDRVGLPIMLTDRDIIKAHDDLFQGQSTQEVRMFALADTLRMQAAAAEKQEKDAQVEADALKCSGWETDEHQAKIS